MSWHRYTDLTDNMILKIARLCNQEQGNLNGVRAEASLMANQLETDPARTKKYGLTASGLYSWVRNGKWFAKAAYYMDNGTASAAQIEAVRDVLVRGKRFFPETYPCDEHDCLSDIKSISTGNVYDKDDYISGKTVIHNRYGSSYLFYCFPASGCDPFGCTDTALAWAKNHGADPQPDERIKVVAHVPEIQRGDSGQAVEVWQTILGIDADGDFGPTTQAYTIAFQRKMGLTADGIVGKTTWNKGLYLE